jgi:hypothetical protein
MNTSFAEALFEVIDMLCGACGRFDNAALLLYTRALIPDRSDGRSSQFAVTPRQHSLRLTLLYARTILHGDVHLLAAQTSDGEQSGT